MSKLEDSKCAGDSCSTGVNLMDTKLEGDSGSKPEGE